jgi:hypothetical protein
VLTELKSTSVQFFDVTLSKVSCFAQRAESPWRHPRRVKLGGPREIISPWKDRAVGCWQRRTAATDLSAERDLEVEREVDKWSL